MSFFRKIRAPFHEDWCNECGATMDVMQKQLFMLPVMVDQYEPTKKASYFTSNLIKVGKKSEIPVGYYACGAHSYRCPDCGAKLVRLSVFLPVRDEEKYEDFIFFKNGEMDEFLRRNYDGK